MTIFISLKYDVAQSGRSLKSYTLLADQDSTDEPTNEFTQSGPTLDDIVTYRGAFSTWRHAAEAIASYLARPFTIVETDLGGYVFRPVDYKIRPSKTPDLAERVIARKTPAGLYVAS